MAYKLLNIFERTSCRCSFHASAARSRSAVDTSAAPAYVPHPSLRELFGIAASLRVCALSAAVTAAVCPMLLAPVPCPVFQTVVSANVPPTSAKLCMMYVRFQVVLAQVLACIMHDRTTTLPGHHTEVSTSTWSSFDMG